MSITGTVHFKNQFLTWARSPSARKCIWRRHSPISPPAKRARLRRSYHCYLWERISHKMCSLKRCLTGPKKRASWYLPLNAYAPMKVTDLEQNRSVIVMVMVIFNPSIVGSQSIIFCFTTVRYLIKQTEILGSGFLRGDDHCLQFTSASTTAHTIVSDGSDISGDHHMGASAA